MFPLPVTSDENLHWLGHVVESGALNGFRVVWAGSPIKKPNKNNIESRHVFILQLAQVFEYAYYNCKRFIPLPEKWYCKCFHVENIPHENRMTVRVANAFVELPFLPESIFERKKTTHKRKRAHSIVPLSRNFPTWRVVEDAPTPWLALAFNDLFRQADEGAIELGDPLDGYDESIMDDPRGKQIYLTIASFVYNHCRDNLGFPVRR